MLETTTRPDLTITPAAPLPEVPACRTGSHYDAKQLRAKIQQLLAAVDRAHDQVRLLCELARERQIHRMLEGPTGAYFRDFTEFCVAPQPWGLGLNEALIEELAKEHRDPKRQARLVLEGPLLLQTRSAPRKGRDAATVPSRGTPYSLQRLKRDRPDLLERVAAGELTIQAAAEQAGHRPPFTGVLVEPQSLARLIVSRLDDAQQRQVVHLVLHPREITDPEHGKPNPFWTAYRARTTPPEELARERERKARDLAARRAASQAARLDRNREQRAARRAQATALGLPSLALPEAAG
jgi:hypothetical protein